MANHQQKTSSIEFIQRLTQFVPIERIYLSRQDYGGMELKWLTILLAKSKKIQKAEAITLVAMVMAAYPEYRFNLFNVHEVLHALHQGSMVFYRICREENLIYASEAPVVLLSTDVRAMAVLKKAKRSFKKDWKKVTDFKEGFQFYFEQLKYPLAAFMLHQVIELSYRAMEFLLIGKEKISHSIHSHQKFMQTYRPDINAVFNEDDAEDMALLILLEEAYCAVRYEEDYMIRREQLLILFAKADLMEQQIEARFEDMVVQFRELLKEEEAMELKQLWL